MSTTADEREVVEYEFTGDVDSLEKATKQSIKLLEQYGKTVSEAAKQGDFTFTDESLEKLASQLSKTVDPAERFASVLKKLSATQDKKIFEQFTKPAVSKDLVEARKQLLKTLSGVSKTLSTEQTRQQSSPRANYIDEMIAKQEKLRKSAKESADAFQKLYKEQNLANAGNRGRIGTATPRKSAKESATFMQQMLDEKDRQQSISTQNYADRLIAQHDRMRKSAKESASVFQELYKSQNKYNAGLKGAVNVAAPSKSAKDSASFFSEFLSEQDRQRSSQPNVIDRMIEFQKQKAEETKRSVQDMGRLLSEHEAALQAEKERVFAQMDAHEKRSAELTAKFYAAQNKNNAGPKGQINVEAPTKSAKESAIVFQELFKQQEKAIREEARANLETEKHVQSSSRLNNALGKLKGKLGEVANKTITCDSAFRKLEKTSHLLKRAFRLVAYSAVGKAIGYAAKQSISFFENLNLFNVAMGKSVDEGKKFVDQMSEVYGMDPSNLYRYIGYFYQLSDAIGMPQESASKMSLALTKASNDLASLINMPIERVTENLASGMQGITKAVSKYGMDVRVAAIRQTALSLGITQQISSMSEADKQGLRFITMMRQASNATTQEANDVQHAGETFGDFANTIEQPANQLRILKEQLAYLARVIGDLFVNSLGKAVQYINTFVMALRMILQFVGGLNDESKETESAFNNAANGADNAASSIAGVGNAAQKASKKLNSMLAPFDELNVLQDKTSSGGGGGGVGGIGEDLGLNPEIAKAIEDMELKIENIKMKAVLARDALLQFLGFELDGNQIVGWDFDTLLANLDHLNEVITAKFPEWATYVGILGGAFITLHSPLNRVFNFFSHPSYALVKKLFDILKDGASYTVPVFGSSLQKATGKVSGLMSILGKLVSVAAPQLVNFFAGVAVAGAAVFIGGFIEWMASSDEFKGHLVKWKDALGKIFKNLKDIALAVFEAIKKAIHYCATHFDWFYDSVADVIGGLLDVLSGITEFVAGAFTGDWKRAWRGVVTAFKGIWKTVVGVAKVPINAVIGLINGMISAITSGINHCIRMINTLSFEVPDWVPKIGGQIWGFNFGYVTAPQIPKLARGGVITSPTMAMIGEGTYDEAVIPLGNSPQMSELVDRIVDATSRRDDTPVQVCVYIGDEQIAEYMHRADRRYMLQTNGGV